MNFVKVRIDATCMCGAVWTSSFHTLCPETYEPPQRMATCPCCSPLPADSNDEADR